MKHLNLKERLETVRNSLRKDPEQARALSHVVKFFVLMVILTLIARGTANAAMAWVELGMAVRHTITHSVQATGDVTPQKLHAVSMPSGLLVSEVPVEVGTHVEAGTVLVQFEEEELELTLLRQEAQLQQLNVRLDTLLEPQPVSDAGLNAALTQRDRALTALEEALDRSLEAETALRSAREGLRTAQEALDALSKDPGSEEQRIEAARAAVSQAEEQVLQAQTEAENAKSAADAAQYAASDAQILLEQARDNYAEAGKQSRRVEESNAAEAELLKLDIEALCRQMEALEAVKAAGCCIVASEAGTVEEVTLTPGAQTGEGQHIRIAPAREGYVLTFRVGPEEGGQLLNAMPVLRISQGQLQDQAAMTGAVTQTADDGGLLCQVRLTSAGWSHQPVQITGEVSVRTYSACVPLSALHQDSGGFFVYVCRTEKNLLGITNLAVRVDVTVEDMDGQYAAVTGDLEMQDQIVLSANKPIRDGDRVRVRP